MNLVYFLLNLIKNEAVNVGNCQINIGRYKINYFFMKLCYDRKMDIKMFEIHFCFLNEKKNINLKKNFL